MSASGSEISWPSYENRKGLRLIGGKCEMYFNDAHSFSLIGKIDGSIFSKESLLCTFYVAVCFNCH